MNIEKLKLGWVADKPINTEGARQVSDIPGVTEQQFFLLVRRRFPDAEIVYEGTEFRIRNGCKEKKSTKPDFRIEKKGRVTFVEITTSNLNGKHPKAYQIEIMTYFPNTRFVVLTKENLLKIQAKNSEVDFFNAKKIK